VSICKIKIEIIFSIFSFLSSKVTLAMITNDKFVLFYFFRIRSFIYHKRNENMILLTNPNAPRIQSHSSQDNIKITIKGNIAYVLSRFIIYYSRYVGRSGGTHETTISFAWRVL